MSFLLALLKRYGYIALFLFFELIAFVLIINFNQKQRDIFLHSSSLFAGSMLEKSVQLNDFLSLEKSNHDLLTENARLLQEIINIDRPRAEDADTSIISFEVLPAKVIKNSISSLRNTFTINKGKSDGIQPSMGVITAQGVVGIVRNVSDHYALVLSLLHTDTRISASLKDEDFFGAVAWDGVAFDKVQLKGLPIHAPIEMSDTIVTNGYSTIFPKDIPIAAVTAMEVGSSGAFYDIDCKPMVDMASISSVYVLLLEEAEELIKLESDE